MACYIFNHPDHKDPNIYKIGKSNNVVVRFMNLSTSYENDILASWYFYPKADKDYASGLLFFIEKTIHKKYDALRRNKSKEFFQIEDINVFVQEILDYFEQMQIPLAVTKNIEDLKDLYDYSIINDELDSDAQKIYVSNNEFLDIPIIPTHLVNAVVKEYRNKNSTQLLLSNTSTLVTQKLSATLIPYLQPYHHQIEILEALNKWHTSDVVSGKLILPPGIGKSYITSFYLRELPESTTVLILVPLKSIKEDFELALTECKVKCQTKVTVYNTARASTYAKKDIVVYDEAHHTCSVENAKLLTLESTKKLFLTATERIINNEDALDMSNDQFGDYIYKMSILEAIQKGLLCDYKIFLSDWNNGLADTIDKLKLMHRKKVIMFFNTVERAKQIHKELKFLNIHSNSITGDTKMTNRAKMISDFTNADFSVICNVGCIAEGVNIPCIDTVMFMEKRESNIGVIQNIGRGLRRYPGKDFCMVVIVEEMLNYKFIENLLVYDERLNNPRPMLISNGLPKKPKKLQGDFDYSIDGIVKMVEVYTSKGLNKVAAFIKRLRSRNIYSATEYHKTIKEYSEDYPAAPLVDLPGFQWEDLLKCSNPYDVNECTDKLLALYETEKDNLKKIKITSDKFIHIYKLDNRIDIKLLEQLKDNKILSKKLNLLFNSIAGRRIIK